VLRGIDQGSEGAKCGTEWCGAKENEMQAKRDEWRGMKLDLP